ncbi:MAG: hypothetical protein AAF067_03420 [Pseudomonadota bacterium]
MKGRSTARSLSPATGQRASYREDQRMLFLSELATSSSVTAAADKAGLAKSTVYFWREKDAEFADAWRTALTSGYELLETELLERARHGTLKPVFHNGRQVGAVRHYNDQTALRLLSLHRETVALERAAREHMGDIGEIRARIDAKLDAMRERLENRRTREQGARGDNELPGASLPPHRAD